MISYDYTYLKSGISFSEEGDTLIIDNDYLLGVNFINSFVDDLNGETEEVYFEKYFQYTIDGIHWSDWEELSNTNLSNINTKFNHIFNIRYKYIRQGSNPSILLYFYSISIDINYIELNIPDFYQSTVFSKYFSYLNKEAIEWSVNVLNKIYNKGVVPQFIERGDNFNWGDEDYINFWWSIIYINGLKISYGKIFSDILSYPDLVRKFLLQKDLIISTNDDLSNYYYLLSYYYDEIMKRGTASVTDKNRTLPSDFSNIVIKGELLRLCSQPSYIESIFGVINSNETGWVVDYTYPGYNYNDLYLDFIRGFEVTKSVEDLTKYNLFNPGSIVLENVSIGEEIIKCIKINSSGGSVYTGIESSYNKSILVDNESDYEISFRIKGLQVGNQVEFGVKGYNFKGDEVDFKSIYDDSPRNSFTTFNNISGDLFIRGFIRHKFYGLLEKLPEIGELINLKFNLGIEKISPFIKITTTNNIYIYDIKVKVLPVTSVNATLLYNSELVIKLLDGYSTLTKQDIVETIITKLIPVNMIVSTSERSGEQTPEEIDTEYLPYTLPFIL